MSCAACGQEVKRGLRFCPMCGRRQSAALPRETGTGGTLLGALLDERRDWRSVLEIVAALCAAIEEVRARGATELALEPSSFYLERRGSAWVATLLDPEPPRREDRDTREMRARPPWLEMPDVSYYSPERIMGKPIDGASDVYTLAVIAYELITGRRPFDKARGPAGLITAQLKQVAPVLSTVTRARIPTACDALFARCLEKDKAKRFARPGELAAAIAEILAAVPDGPRYASRRTGAAATISVASPIVRIIPAQSCGSKTCKTLHRLVATDAATLIGSWLWGDHIDTALTRQPAETVHPHVGMATISYLFEGQLEHRDSLGNRQMIKPGDLSWMVAGAGLAHTECQRPADLARGARLHRMELWVALPRPNEDDPGSYRHVRAADLPSVVIGGVRVRVIIGEGFGAASPVAFPSPLAMYDVRIPANAAVPLPLPGHHDYQRAVYVVSGAVEIGDEVIEARRLVVLRPGASVGVRANGGKPAHIVGLGSAPVLGPRYAWWYFSSSSRARIEEAKRRWAAGEIGAVAGDLERAPLPRV